MTSAARNAGNAARGAADDTASRAEDSRALRGLARAGYVMSGIIHILIGWVALRLALGDGGGSADQSGALGSVAQAPGGRVLLGIGAVGMLALGLWSVLQAYVEARRRRGRRARIAKAVSNGGKAVVFLAMAVTAARFALGSGQSSSQQTSGTTSMLLGHPGGRILVVLVGAVVIAIGGYHVYKGPSRRFEEDLRGARGRQVSRAVVGTGVAGFIAKGIALIAVGALFGWAGIGSDPEKATGLDGALRTMAGLPAGSVLLAVVGIGLVLYGIFSFFRARYEDLDS